MPTRSFRALAPIALLLLTGCGTQVTTPDAMREYVRGDRAFSKKETFEVPRPYAAVTQDLKRRSEDCLNKTFQITRESSALITIGSRSSNDGYTRYIPVSTIGPAKAEFYTKHLGSKARAANPPADDK